MFSMMMPMIELNIVLAGLMLTMRGDTAGAKN
jgi:hypothetical protein